MTEEEARIRLDELRELIDNVDQRIVTLLNERTLVVENIGKVKKQAGLPVYEPKREDLVYQNITACNQGPLSADAMRRIFERVIDEMRQIQRMRMQQDGAK